MSCRYAVLEDGRWVLERWSGDVDAEEIVAHEESQVADARIAPGAVGLADLRHARFPGEGPYDLEGLALAHERSGGAPRFSRFALVAEAPEVFLKSRSLELAMERVGIRVVVFTSLRTACDWLGVDAARVTTELAALSRTG
ncbi:MAG: hypothetical protein AMXMBFR36_13790 [Acidobacteriota bacterium]